MAANTTLNINLAIMDRINMASEITGKSRSKIIIMLLMKVLAHENSRERKSGTVQYQGRDDKNMWKTFHITYTDDEYAYFLDLRKLLRMTVSLAVAYAVKNYLDKILYGKDTDIYQFQKYSITRNVVNGAITWTIFWGKPQKTASTILYNTS